MKLNTELNKHNLKVDDVINLEVYAEECCEECCEIIHNHLNCPICGDEYADSDQWSDMYNEKEIKCCECGTIYELVEGSWYYGAKVKIKELG